MHEKETKKRKNVFELEHIGINMGNEEEATKLAELLCSLFNIEIKKGNKSIFAGKDFELMKSPFLGKNGHIAMRTKDLEAAMAELKEKGVEFNMDTAAYFDDGKMKNIYLAGEYGGFAIHVIQK